MNIRPPLAVQNYVAARPATEPKQDLASSGAAFSNMATDFVASLRESENIAKQSMAGNADPHALVQALAQTELAVETAVTVRDKVVEAYQEILRMPV